jgi:hypothetical protein
MWSEIYNQWPLDRAKPNGQIKPKISVLSLTPFFLIYHESGNTIAYHAICNFKTENYSACPYYYSLSSSLYIMSQEAPLLILQYVL